MKRLIQLIATILTITLFAVSTTVTALTKQDYQKMGLLPYKGEPYFTLGKLDKLGRPTWAHIQFHDFIEAKAAKKYRNPKKKLNGNTGALTDYLPGFQGNNEYYLIPSELNQGHTQKVWSPRKLLSPLWTDNLSSNTVRNYALITSYADNGYPLDKRKGLFRLRDYEKALDDWTSSSSSYWNSKKGHQRYMVDYKIELIYQGEELVPRQLKIRYVGLTEKGKLKKIDLDGAESFDQYGIATVVIDNIAPNVTIDYLTGNALGTVYTPKTDGMSTDNPSDEEVYVDIDTGYYYYDVKNPDNYVIMTEREALDDGYIWDALEK